MCIPPASPEGSQKLEQPQSQRRRSHPGREYFQQRCTARAIRGHHLRHKQFRSHPNLQRCSLHTKLPMQLISGTLQLQGIYFTSCMSFWRHRCALHRQCMHAFIHACMHNCDYRRNEPSACSMPEPEKPQCQQSRTPSPLPCSVTPVIHSSALEPVHTRLVKSAPLGDVNRTCNPSSHS